MARKEKTPKEEKTINPEVLHLMKQDILLTEEEALAFIQRREEWLLSLKRQDALEGE